MYSIRMIISGVDRGLRLPRHIRSTQSSSDGREGQRPGTTFRNAQYVCVCVCVHECLRSCILSCVFSRGVGGRWNVTWEGGRKRRKQNTVDGVLKKGRKKMEAKLAVGVDLALGRLRKLHVFLARHEPSQLQQHHPDAVGVLPLGQRRHCMHVDLRTDDRWGSCRLPTC